MHSLAIIPSLIILGCHDDFEPKACSYSESKNSLCGFYVGEDIRHVFHEGCLVDLYMNHRLLFASYKRTALS